MGKGCEEITEMCYILPTGTQECDHCVLQIYTNEEQQAEKEMIHNEKY